MRPFLRMGDVIIFIQHTPEGNVYNVFILK